MEYQDYWQFDCCDDLPDIGWWLSILAITDYVTLPDKDILVVILANANSALQVLDGRIVSELEKRIGSTEVVARRLRASGASSGGLDPSA